MQAKKVLDPYGRNSIEMTVDEDNFVKKFEEKFNFRFN